MKTLLRIILILGLVFVVACSQGDTKDEKKVEEETKIENVKPYESKFWKAEVPEEWVKDEELSKAQDKSEYTVFKDKAGEEIAKIEFRFSDNPKDIRSEVLKQGYLLEDFKEKKIEGGIEVAGEYGIQYPKAASIEAMMIRLRKETAKADVKMEFLGKELSDEAKNLLKTFEFVVEDESHKDPPYPFEGKAHELTPGNGLIGDIKLSGEFLKLAEPFMTYDIFEVDGVPSGEYFYLLNKKKIKIYNQSQGMKLEKEIDLEGEYDHIDATADGRVWVSSIFGGKAFIIEDLEKTIDLSFAEYLRMNPDGEWGIAYTTITEKATEVTIDEKGIVTRKEIKYVDGSGEILQENINDLYILDNKIGIAGTPKDEKNPIVAVYDREGKLLLRLEGSEKVTLGAIKGLVETEKGYIASDANMRKFVAWQKDGTLIGEIDDQYILGTHYPWMARFFKAEEGNYYVIATEQREDKSSLEVLVFKVNIE